MHIAKKKYLAHLAVLKALSNSTIKSEDKPDWVQLSLFDYNMAAELNNHRHRDQEING